MKPILVDNITRELLCLHCGGSRKRRQGIVCLDTEGHGIAAPCPMCLQGEAINRAQYASTYWTQIRNVLAVTWQNGLTARHRDWCTSESQNGRRCFRPSIGAHCDYHADAANRRNAGKGLADAVAEARIKIAADQGLRRGAYLEQETA